MNKLFEPQSDWKTLRQKIMGFGENYTRKTYYSELQKRIRQLQESETWLLTIFNSIHDVILVCDPATYTILDVNLRMCELFHYTQEEAQHLNLSDLSFEESETIIPNIPLEYKGEPHVYDWQVKDRLGKPIWLETILHRTAIGSQEILLVVGRDVSERRKMEKEKQDFYRETILNATSGKLEICDSRVIDSYRNSCSLWFKIADPSELGLSRDTINNFCREFLDSDRLDEFMIGVGEAFANLIKHCGKGNIYAGKNTDSVWVLASDTGPGIEALILPQAVFKSGFSTKKSMGFGYSIMLQTADKLLLNTGRTGTDILLMKNKVEKLDISLDDIQDILDSIPG